LPSVLCRASLHLCFLQPRLNLSLVCFYLSSTQVPPLAYSLTILPPSHCYTDTKNGTFQPEATCSPAEFCTHWVLCRDVAFTRQKVLSQHGRGSPPCFKAKHCAVKGLTLPTSHPEVLGVHVQLVAVQLRQLGVGVLDVVQVLHGFPKGAQHFLTMSTDPGVAHDGGGAGEVPKGRKEPLGPGVDDQQPVERWGTEAHTSNCSRFPTQGAAEPMPEAGPTWPGLQPHIRPH
uniref:Uncharacterized protein n=1 Tax=Gallus gallus TaxID=9031 RepID=A0A8V0XDH6_CHICK